MSDRMKLSRHYSRCSRWAGSLAQVMRRESLDDGLRVKYETSFEQAIQ